MSKGRRDNRRLWRLEVFQDGGTPGVFEWWSWRLRSANGRLVAMSPDGYPKRGQARRAGGLLLDMIRKGPGIMTVAGDEIGVF